MKDLRRLILKGVLVSLALAAVAGVLGVLADSDVILRVMGTGIATAVAAVLLMPLSAMVDRKNTRSAGLLGTAVVTVEFILALMLIWELDRVLPGRWGDEEVWITGGMVAGCGLPAMLCLWRINQQTTRWAGYVGVVFATAVFVAAMLGTWLPRPPGPAYQDWRRASYDFWATSGTLAGFGVIIVAALIGAGKGDRRHWRWLGVATAAVATVVLLIHIWADTGGSEEMFSLLVTGSIYVAFANLLFCVPLKPGQIWLRIGTLAAGAATAVFGELIIFGAHDSMTVRLTAASAILTSCGALALRVLARLNRRVDFESRSREFADITVVCPRCRKKQAVGLGGAACRFCNLRIEVRVEEPVCRQCGYLLYHLTSDVCPECGTPIRQETRT